MENRDRLSHTHKTLAARGNTPSSSFDFITIFNKNAAIQTARDQEF
jgi:hypothetical protein